MPGTRVAMYYPTNRGGRRRAVCAGVRRGKIERSPVKSILISTEELRVHTETDVERVGTAADADTERLTEEDPESAEERRRSAYRLT